MGMNPQVGIIASGQPNLGDAANAVLSGVLSAVGPSAPFCFRGPMNLEIYASYNTALTTTAASLAATVGAAGGIAAGGAIKSINVVPGTTVKTIAGNNITLAVPPLTIWGRLRSNGYAVLRPPSGAFGFAPQLVGSTVTIESNVSGVTLAAGTTVLAVIQNDIPSNDTSPGQEAILQLSNAPNVAADKLDIPLQFAPTANIIAVSGADAAAIFTGAGITWSGTVQLERSFDGGNTWIVCNIGATGTLAQWTGATVGPISITFGEPEKNVLYRLNCTAFTSGTINYRISQTGGAAESLAIGPLSSG
jgi:hypothetical protein